MNDSLYYKQLAEISSYELFDGLLGYGLFNEKIPSFLDSNSFLSFCKNMPNNYNFTRFHEQNFCINMLSVFK